MPREEARFCGIRFSDWCVIANLACIGVVAALVTLTVSSLWQLRWYWLLGVFLAFIWPISYFVERFPAGTRLVQRVLGHSRDNDV